MSEVGWPVVCTIALGVLTFSWRISSRLTRLEVKMNHVCKRLGIVVLVALSSCAPIRVQIEGPATYQGKNVGNLDVGEGGRVLVGYDLLEDRRDNESRQTDDPERDDREE